MNLEKRLQERDRSTGQFSSDQIRNEVSKLPDSAGDGETPSDEDVAALGEELEVEKRARDERIVHAINNPAPVARRIEAEAPLDDEL